VASVLSAGFSSFVSSFSSLFSPPSVGSSGACSSVFCSVVSSAGCSVVVGSSSFSSSLPVDSSAYNDIQGQTC